MKNFTTIPARKCTVEEIDSTLAHEFMDNNHRQKSARKVTALKNLALFFNGEIVGVVQFCNPRTSQKYKNYSTELLRLAFRKNTRVQGGASKLIKKFI